MTQFTVTSRKVCSSKTTIIKNCIQLRFFREKPLTRGVKQHL